MNYLVANAFLIKPLYGVIVASFFYGVFSAGKMIISLFKVLGCLLGSKKATATIISKESRDETEKVVNYVYKANLDVKGEKIENKDVLVSFKPQNDQEYIAGTKIDVYWSPIYEEAVDIRYQLRKLGENALFTAVAIGVIVLAFLGIMAVDKK